jgi:hypothetical protein
MSDSNGDHLLAMIRREYPEYHPLVSIARIAHRDDADLKLQFECHKTISKFIEPELKSVENKGGQDDQRRVVISMFPDKPHLIERGNTYGFDGQVIQDIEDVDAVVEETHRDSNS